MEKMPYRPEPSVTPANPSATTTALLGTGTAVTSDWRQTLPVLTGAQVVLRELRPADAATLHALLTTEEVARFISPPPTTVDGFERFIAWALKQRGVGAYACFAVTIAGYDNAIGIFQLRDMDRGFDTVEWGFAIGSSFWGTGVFQESAELVLEFVFETLHVHRLEARAAVLNARGIGALRKIGAVQEGVLRKSLERNGEFLDQALYTVLASDWREGRALSLAANAVVH